VGRSLRVGRDRRPFEELVEGGVRALEAALRLTAEDREAAWALLAADALLTWAVEDAADTPEPERALEAVTRALIVVERAHGHRQEGSESGAT
jgi:hypothetical protein